MLLLIDAGNTRIKWALQDCAQTARLGEWHQSGLLSHQELSDRDPPWSKFAVQRVVISNVAGKMLGDQIARTFHHQVEWFSGRAEMAGVQNLYRDPTQLGSDRFAAAIGAHALFPGEDLIIATCGTATTIDAVTADGDFIGGMIAPGLKLMAHSLAQNTAQLPAVLENISAVAHFANHTDAAIVSGCLAAQAGAIEHAARDFATTAKGRGNPLCILSGGAAHYIIPSLTVPHKFVDNLVLIGLQVALTC